MDKKNSAAIFAIGIVGALFIPLFLLWTNVDIVSGGFSDPKAILLQGNDTREVEISTNSIIPKDVIMVLSVNYRGIGIMPTMVSYSNGNEFVPEIDCRTDCMAWGTTVGIKQRTENGKATFNLKILDSSITPPGEYELKVSLKSVTYPYITYSTHEIPIYVGYQIKDK